LIFTLPEINSKFAPENGSVMGILLGGSSHFVSELIPMAIVCPLSRVNPLPNGLFMAYKWGLLTTRGPQNHGK